MTTIDTRLGAVKGIDTDGVSVFRGIPYAAPPIGDLRWQPPQTATPWDGPFDATQYGNRALQPPYPDVLDFGEIPGKLSEDCLYLNIFTPSADGQARPVMFWIHGGAYIQGSANEYDGSTLARDNDVVVVAINYRLGIFGFADLAALGADYAGSVSLGFQDQVQALSWVRDNISDYGGDPGNVTIWGESAGGGSVLALLGTPSADGLFHKAVAFSPGEVMGPSTDAVAPLAARMDVEGEELQARLLATAAEDLFALQLEGIVGASASVDGTIVTRPASVAIRERGDSGVPLIAGCTKDEGTLFAPVIDTGPGAVEALTSMFGLIIGNGDSTRYPSWLDRTMPDATPAQRMIQCWYDMFRASSLRTALAATEAGVGGWVYNFDVPTDHPLGTTHASDVPFTFNLFKTGGGFGFHDASDPAIRDLAGAWSATFAAFARTGDPNGAGLPAWPRYDAGNRSCLVVDQAPHVVSDPDGEELLAVYGIG